MRYSSLLLLVLVTAFLAVAADPKHDPIVADALTPQQMIPGDVSQIYEGAYFAESTKALNLTNAGLWGYDEGSSVQLADGRILWLTGDAVGAYFDVANAKWMGTTKKTNCNDGHGSTGSCLGVDTALLLTPTGNEWACSHLGDVSAAMIAGNATPSVGYTNCPTISAITDASHTSTQPKFVYLSEHSSGLTGSETLLGGRTPRGAFSLGGAMYVVYGALHQNRSKLSYHLQNAFMKVSDTTAITATAFPTMTKLYNFSIAPAIPNGNSSVTIGSAVVTRTSGTNFDSAWTDLTQWSLFEVDGNEYTISSVDTTDQITLATPITAGKTCLTGSCTTILWSAPPSISTRPGKFMFCGIENFTHAQTLTYGWNGFLPSALQSAANVVMAQCSGFYYRHSNVSMLAIDASLLDSSTNSGSGVNNAWYMTGLDSQSKPTWIQGNESAAVPMLNSWNNASGAPCVGEMSTRYFPTMRRWVMAYGAAECGGLRMRTASYPWGPWSQDTRVMPNAPDAGWEGRLMFAPSDPRNPNFNQSSTAGVQLYDANQACCVVLNNSSGGAPFSSAGNPYGPWMWPSSTSHDNGDGTMALLTNISGFDPYVVWQARMDLVIPRNTRSTAFHGTGRVSWK